MISNSFIIFFYLENFKYKLKSNIKYLKSFSFYIYLLIYIFLNNINFLESRGVKVNRLCSLSYELGNKR